MLETIPSCRCIFEDLNLHGPCLQDEVFKNYPSGDCESQKVTSASPGQVMDDECLTRLIIHPIHFDERTGIVLPLAFQDACTLDLSLFREDLAKDSEIQLSIEEIRSNGLSKTLKQNKIVSAVFQSLASDIRKLFFDDDNSRMCFVYDTATAEKPAHASVFTPARTRDAGSLNKTRKYQREVRKKLFDLFNKNSVKLQDYRNLNY